nr:hypothetical protein [uncultured Sphaerochaeta sp.]
MSDRTQERIDADISAFVETMRYKLAQNNHKGYWDKSTLLRLANRVKEELDEVVDAILTGTLEDVQNEAADVGNFAMFIHSNAKREQEKKA